MSLLARFVRWSDFAMRVRMRMGSRLQPQRQGTTRFGASLKLDLRQFIQRRLYYFGIFEHNLTTLLGQTLRPGDVVLDIGANVGYYTLLASKLVGPDGLVVAVEPTPATLERLREHVAMNHASNVRIESFAVTPARCRLKTVSPDPRNNGADSVTPDAQGTIEGRPIAEIAGDALTRASVIKIDIEGGEAELLETLLAMQSSLSPRLLIAIEIKIDPTGLITRFRDAGFAVHAINNSYAIDYYLLRSGLHAIGRDNFVEMAPTTAHIAGHEDYVLLRGA